MKKVVRTVWISALSGLAFLAACCASRGVSKAERRQLIKDRDSIQNILQRREGAAVYGSPELIQKYHTENLRLRNQLDSLNLRIEALDNPEKAARRQELQQQLDSIQTIIRRREGAAVYGSPEIIERYGKETLRLRNEAANIEKELEELDKDE